MSALTEGPEAALAEVMDNERGMLARTVVVAEVLDEEGERMLLVLASSGMPEWDAPGLCRYGMLSIENPAGGHFSEEEW